MMQFICDVNGINVADHFIYRSENEIFSYRTTDGWTE